MCGWVKELTSPVAEEPGKRYAHRPRRSAAPSPGLTSALQVAGGQPDVVAGSVARRVTASVQRVLDRLGDVPVIVIDPSWTIVAGNALAEAYLGGPVVGSDLRLVIWTAEPGTADGDALRRLGDLVAEAGDAGAPRANRLRFGRLG